MYSILNKQTLRRSATQCKALDWYVTSFPLPPQELDLSHCRLGEVWWPAGEGSCTALRRLVLRGATLGGSAAGEAAGLAALIR